MKKRNVSDWASPRATGAEAAGAHTSDAPRPKTGEARLRAPPNGGSGPSSPAARWQ